RPSFVIRRASDTGKWVRFAGLPMGHEFTSLVLALLWAGGHPPKVSEDVLRQIENLEGDYNFEMYFSLSCHNCPDVVQALTLMALNNPRITATLIEGGAFQEEVDARGVMAVPATFLNGEMFASGKMTVEELLAKLDGNAAARAAARLGEKEPFDVLVIGGGPAGGRHLRRAQGLPDRHRRGALRRAGARHARDRELHLGALHRGAAARAPARGARARERHRPDDAGRGRTAGPGEEAGRLARG